MAGFHAACQHFLEIPYKKVYKEEWYNTSYTRYLILSILLIIYPKQWSLRFVCISVLSVVNIVLTPLSITIILPRSVHQMLNILSILLTPISNISFSIIITYFGWVFLFASMHHLPSFRNKKMCFKTLHTFKRLNNN